MLWSNHLLSRARDGMTPVAASHGVTARSDAVFCYVVTILLGVAGLRVCNAVHAVQNIMIQLSFLHVFLHPIAF